MSLSLYEISVPVMIRGLKIASALLQRGATFALDEGIAEDVLLTKRLWPDMLPLTGQIQRASDTAKFTAVRVGQAENLPMADNESTFESLQHRINTTVAFLEGVDPKGYAGRETAEITLPGGKTAHHYSGQSYLLEFALPNFWFHVTTTYDILRAAGVPIGKRHFLGWE